MLFLRFWFVAGILSTACVSAESPKPHVVILIAEEEYETKVTLPEFAERSLGDYRVTLVSADPDDRNRMAGIEAVESADVLLVSVRRRTLPKTQLDIVRRYVDAGKPVIGIRTASHAFCLRNQDPSPDRDAWPEFDREVFGGNYTNHYGNKLQATISVAGKTADAKRFLRGIDMSRTWKSSGSLYRVSPLARGAKVLLTGRVEGHPPEPVAWTFRRSDGGKSFYTSLGHVDDFRGDVLPVCLLNAITWCLEP